METSTNIKKMLAGKTIIVPKYQRAYSWDTEKQVNVFLRDLEAHNSDSSEYYFGHFLFEERRKGNGDYGVIDGQQRITTIIIFLSALFAKLQSIRDLSEDETHLYEDMIKRGSNYIFSTVDYDNQIFRDYVIDKTKKNTHNIETASAKRITNAFDYFTECLLNRDEQYLKHLLEIVKNATCSTHIVKNESEAIQMFIFQNNRGKRPTNLEIIKAQFMFHIHLCGEDEKDNLIKEIKDRFETIYKSISSIEYKINEDEVLLYTLQVYFNSLWEDSALNRIDTSLSEEDPIRFIKGFTYLLAESFGYLTNFFGEAAKKHIEIYSLIQLGSIAIAIPFIIKAYCYQLTEENICKLCTSIESLILRHKLIGTKARITSRIRDEFQGFNESSKSINPIIEKIDLLKATEDWWRSYWNNERLEYSIRGYIHPSIARFILWKYENYLIQKSNSGYKPMRLEDIKNPELEHIAPQKPKNEPIAVGYCEYDEEFENEYIDCLGNYLLVSKSHNASIGNKSFAEKRESYNILAQQREIQEMTKDTDTWTKDSIDKRRETLVKFVTKNF